MAFADLTYQNQAEEPKTGVTSMLANMTKQDWGVVIALGFAAYLAWTYPWNNDDDDDDDTTPTQPLYLHRRYEGE